MQEAAHLKEFIRGASRLPVLPKVTIRLLNSLDSPGVSAKEIAEIVEAEPTLTARLLKLANSSFYGQRGRISHIRSAVTVLGSKTIRSFALAVWTHTLQTQARNADELRLLAPLLAHGLASAVAARMLADRVDPGRGEDSFMAGLLHDIGRVALVAQMGREYQAAIVEPARRDGVSLHEREAQVLGFDHRVLGSALMASWELPPFLLNVVEKHHDSEIVPEQDFYVAAVALADGLSTRMGFNIALDAPRPVPPGLAAGFGLADDGAVAEFLELCLARFRILSAVLVARA
jgi:HD-like signal output (HDOD) protein